jgi:NAD(P)H-dependent FMN reductase
MRGASARARLPRIAGCLSSRPRCSSESESRFQAWPTRAVASQRRMTDVAGADPLSRAETRLSTVSIGLWHPCPHVPRLLVIIASTRPGRIGLPVANWFVREATAHDTFELETVDLAELRLPLLDEPKHPRLREYTKDHTHAWSATVDAADAVVMVTSEYNYGYPPALKNAIDFLHHEWRYKPVGFVSYGGVAAGTRAVQQLKQVVTALAMMPTQASVNIPFVNQFLGEDGTITPNEVMVQAVPAMLDELLKLEEALAPLRAE